MTKPMTKIHNVEIDEVIEREMTDEEFAAFSAIQAETQSQQTAEESKAAAKASVLEKLGLTAKEAVALLA